MIQSSFYALTLRAFTITLSLTLLTTFSVGQSSAFAKAPKPLFQNDEMLKIRIEAPLKDLIKKAANSTAPYPATLSLISDASEPQTITLSARGRSRRGKNFCKFPPLRIEFNEKPKENTLFHKQKRLKLVTHCRLSNSYQQYYLLEYTAYKLFNVMTENSLNVRMAEIDYVEASTGKTLVTKIGFFIEDTDDAAKRNGMKEIDLPDISKSQLNTQAAARYGLFQYMIGNLDWSMHNGPEDRDCCHNTKLIAATKDAVNDLTPVPYDFDYAGIVNTPYAAAPPNLRINSVRTRYYRGFCIHNEETRIEAALATQNQQAFYDAVDAIPALSDKNKRSTIKYLGKFFKDVQGGNIDKKLFSKCRQ